MIVENPFALGKIYTPTQSSLKKANSDDYYELQKKATFFKGKGDWDTALACLYKAKEISLQNKHSTESQYLTRLAIFLQQAEMFDEAVSELHDLFELTDIHTKYLLKGLKKHKKLYFSRYRAKYLGHLFDKAALIYKRQEELKTSIYFKELSDKYHQEGDRLDGKISDIESAEYEKELEELAKPESKLTEDDWKKIRKLTNKSSQKSITSKESSEMILGFIFLGAIIYSIYAYFF